MLRNRLSKVGALTLYLWLLVAWFSTGCKTWNAVSPTTWQESFIIEQCHRAAEWHGKPGIKCVITSDSYPTQGQDGNPLVYSGWWDRGTAYFWQKWVNEQEEPRLLTELACHETSHSKIKEHSAAFYELVGRCVAEVGN